MYGIGKYFSFRVGPLTCAHTNEEDLPEMHLEDRSEKSLHQEMKLSQPVYAPLAPALDHENLQHGLPPAAEAVMHLVAENQAPPNCHFLAIPSEIRIIIYKFLLISAGPIANVHKLLGSRRSVMVAASPQVKDIDAAFLRTTRLIYHEALHILYAKNRFYFDSPDAIEEFAFTGLSHNHVFGMKSTPYGRLTWLTHVILRLGGGILPILRDPGRLVDRERLWRDWSDFFDPPFGRRYPLETKFPALEALLLDFSDWELDGGEESEIQVSLPSRSSSSA